MTVQRRNLLIAAILLFCGVHWGHCLNAEFFINEYYDGIFEDVVINGPGEFNCTKLRTGEHLVKSVKTDRCLILYHSPNCKWPKWPFKFSVPSEDDDLRFNFRLDKNTPILNQYVNSFHVCSQELGGGPRLDLDVFLKYPGGENDPLMYRDVCRCRNVLAKYAGGKSFPILINNYGNSVNLYDHKHCKGKSVRMEAGITFESLMDGSYPFDVKSFIPADLNCSSLTEPAHNHSAYEMPFNENEARRHSDFQPPSILSFLRNSFHLFVKNFK